MNQHMTPAPAVTGPAADFAARTHKLLISGQWEPAASGKTFEVIDPASGRAISHVAEGDAVDADRAVAAARAAFEGPWSRVTPVERGKLIWRLAEAIDANREELATLNSLENGKPIRSSMNEVPWSAEVFRYYAGWATKITGAQIPVSDSADFHCYTVREPVGVAAQIIPWNFPLSMLSWKLAPALAAGCTMVLKPAEQTPLGALRIAELFAEVGFPDGVLNVITGFGETAGAALAGHPGVDKVAFTGSTDVGRIIVRAAAGNLKKVSLELGGKSPTIVMGDADIEAAIAGASDAIFFNMGQCCTAGSRLFVHESIYDRVVEGVAAGAEKLRIGPGLAPDTEIGPLISKEQLEKVTGFIAEGRRDGAEIVAGGERAGNEGYFVAPTVITRTRPEMSVVREEIFGPVVCAIPFGGDLDAVAREANATSFGLAASIWTRDLGVAHRLAAKVKAGTVWVNTHNFNDVALPFGGYKQSGWGRELGAEAIDLYTQTKAVAVQLPE